MSTAGLFLSLAISVTVLAFVLWPLLFGTTKPKASATSEDSDLQTDREAILDTLRTLDFDFQTGKILEEDYRLQRAQLVARGADVLRQIDEMPRRKSTKK